MTAQTPRAKARAAREALDAKVRSEVAAIAFPLPRPDALTKDEVIARQKAVDEAVAGIEYPSRSTTSAEDRAARQALDARVVAAVAKASR